MIEYFDVERIWEIHEIVLNVSGGLKGYKDKEGISQICDFMQNDLYYPTFLDKLVYLIFSISKNHFFNDGNKRTALAAGSLFLSLNGYNSKLDLYITEMETYIVELVEGKITRIELVKILKNYLD